MRSRIAIAATCIAAMACVHPAPPPIGERASIAPPRSTAESPPADSVERIIAGLWAAYIAEKDGRFAANAGTRSGRWLASEQDKWPMYDLAGFYLPDGAVPGAVNIRSTTDSPGREYEIVTRFLPSGTRLSDSATAVMTMTVFAVLEGDHWVLANALPRKTARWRQETVGPINYAIEPGLAFDRTGANRAVGFIDSLTSAFDVARVEHLDYYVVSSVDAALNNIGVDLPVKYGSNGAFAKPINHQLFSGNPELGANYRHELVHLALLPISRANGTTLIASEGVATWLGGTNGIDFHDAVRSLMRYLAVNPQIDLDSIVDSHALPQEVTYSGGAVLCDMLAKGGGTSAIKEFLTANSSRELRSSLVRLLRKPWPAIVADWRSAVVHLAFT